jgi:hypothetical protein
VWKELLSKAEAERAVLCKHLDGKALFLVIPRMYTAIHRELRDSPVTDEQTEEFRKQRRRKRNPSEEDSKKSKTSQPTPGPRDPRMQPQPVVTPKAVPTKNFFAPLRGANMEMESCGTEENQQDEAPTVKTGKPPPIVITATTNLLQLQNIIRGVVKENFEFRNTRNGTRVLTHSLTDFAAVKSYLESRNLAYFTYPKSLKPIKAVLRHLPTDTPAEDISDGLIDAGFDIISVKQMTSTRRSPTEGTRNLPLFLITLPRTAKSQDIFQLKTLCHISIRVRAYKSQNGLTQCHNCQQFGHVWANCKQPPRCMWCGGGHLHKGCPEKENAASIPACCNCRLAEGEKLHPANYRG